MKANSLFLILTILSMNLIAQKQSLDVISFSTPKGWEQKQYDGGIQLSVTDKTGAYVIAIITKALASNASANENFSNRWSSLVKAAVTVNEEPTMEQPSTENGWEIVSGMANYTDGAQHGAATLLTATGGGQMTSVVLMTNTNKYQDEIMAFISSLELKKVNSNQSNNTNQSTNGNSSIAGLWVNNLLETSGYANGYPQYTAGYFRREYLFNENGTYIFRVKNWSAYMKEILFVYETGNYTIQGNQITITPQKGMGEWWSKKNNNTSLWGSRLKSSTYKAEKVTYTFEVKYYSGSNDHALLLDSKKTTERDGTYNGPNSFSYKKWEDGVSKIDNPPGFKP